MMNKTLHRDFIVKSALMTSSTLLPGLMIALLLAI